MGKGKLKRVDRDEPLNDPVPKPPPERERLTDTEAEAGATVAAGLSVLLGMSKRGDAYLRTLLIHGARAVIYRTRQNPDGSTWLHKLIRRRNVNVAAVALANKNARIAWALLARDRQYRTDYRAPGMIALAK